MAEAEKPNIPAEVFHPLQHEFPENIESKFATHFTIQRSDIDFILCFYEVYPSILLTEADQREYDSHPERPLRAKCVARIHIPPEAMQDIIGILLPYWQNYQKERGRTGGLSSPPPKLSHGAFANGAVAATSVHGLPLGLGHGNLQGYEQGYQHTAVVDTVRYPYYTLQKSPPRVDPQPPPTLDDLIKEATERSRDLMIDLQRGMIAFGIGLGLLGYSVGTNLDRFTLVSGIAFILLAGGIYFEAIRPTIEQLLEKLTHKR